MKRESRNLYIFASMFIMAVIIGSLLYTSPVLAWDTWPSAVNNDANHTWTVVFDQAMNTATINSDNIYVSNDITGRSVVAGVSVSASDSNHALVVPPAGGWSTDTSYYLIITQKVLTGANMPLKDEVRMPFRIVVETKAPSTIDVTNDGSNITVKVNGNQLSFDQPPYIANGSTMVPFRTIAEALGAQVDWDSAKQKITIMGDKTVELIVNSKTAKINGVSSTLDNPPVITGGRTMVPLRFVGETMGAKVNYTSLIKPKPISLEIRGNEELWVKYSDGHKELLVNDFKQTYMENPRFSLDGTKVYFGASNGNAGSCNTYAVNIKDKIVKHITYGCFLKVINEGEYKGNIIVSQHQYYGPPNYGSYDEECVVDDNGNILTKLN